MVALGKRIVTVGCRGAGKTHVAKALAERLEFPYICNDMIIHGPNWAPTPAEQRTRRFDLVTNTPAWMLDGRFSTYDRADNALVLSRADTLIWLDLPRRQGFPARRCHSAWSMMSCIMSPKAS